MIKSMIFFTFTIFLMLTGAAWSDCPEDEYDRGVCDTMYVEPWPDDIPLQGSSPYFIRVPIYTTSDVVNDLDSIIGFTIPLCYTHTEPSLYCSLSGWWNTTDCNPFFPSVTQNRSIFRHLPTTQDPQIHNRMMDMASDFPYRDWDFKELTLDGTSHFWLIMVPTSSDDQRWWDGSWVLLATMTFKLESNMQICIDTCLWPPSSHLAWAVRDDVSDSRTKVPRSGTGTDIYGGCFNSSEVKEIQSSENSRPLRFSLSQNYPNPFNPVTNFEFSLARSTHVRIDIFNILGQRVKTLLDAEMKPGVYSADWDGRNDRGNAVSSGIYFYRMIAEGFSETKRMVLLK